MDIALQHISDRMLKRMRRVITKQETLDLIARFRKEVPGIHLRTTLMVGFPGETDDDFNELLNFVESERFERLGAFAYSHEAGTYAYKNYKDDVPFEIKEARLEQLMGKQQKIAEAINDKKVGQILKVIIDREEGDYYIGRTEFDSPEVDPEVLIQKTEPLKIGQFYNIKINGTDYLDLIGSVGNL
jgi:ribosomal protein S12 methylthiotransferase